MKPSILLTITVAIAASMFVLCAEPITGAIGFGGEVTFNTSSAGTATAITDWWNTLVISDSGTFASPPYKITPVAPAIFTNVTWNFNTTTPITNFWSAGGFSFELLGSQIVAQGGSMPGDNGYVVITGAGIVSGNGFNPTVFSWSFSAQDPISDTNPNQWTFSAECNSVPPLQGQMTTNAIILAWPSGLTLQASPTLNGPFTDVQNATSPYTNSFTGSQQFFRLKIYP